MKWVGRLLHDRLSENRPWHPWLRSSTLQNEKKSIVAQIKGDKMFRLVDISKFQIKTSKKLMVELLLLRGRQKLESNIFLFPVFSLVSKLRIKSRTSWESEEEVNSTVLNASVSELSSVLRREMEKAEEEIKREKF